MGDYLSQALSESPEALTSAVARSEVCICHVDSFTELLSKIVNPDPMEVLPQEYKEGFPAELDDTLAKIVDGFGGKAKDIYIGMGTFAEAFLASSHVGKNTAITEWLIAAEDYF